MRCASLSNSVYNKKTTIKLLILNFKFMKNEFFKFSSRRILFSTVMASALLAGSPQAVFAEVNELQSVMQAGTVKGQVVDAAGEPVIGATVQVKGTTNGTITDFDGNFILNNVPEKGILVISYIGYKAQEVNISGKTSIKVVVKEDTEVLDEVVVVGYGAQKKASLTSSISQIKGDEAFKNKGIANATVALQGEVPGLTITRTSTRPGSEGAEMKIRGDISVNGKSSPLVIIDGITGSLDELNAMDASDIENISVLKDASAAIYGARSASGVVLVTTKRGKKGKAQISYSGSVSRTINGIQPPITNNQEWPLFTPTRMGIPRSFATSTTALIRSVLPIFPGLIRILSAPFSMAAIARR